MGSYQTLQPTPSLITIPSNYPTEPTPGKLEVLWRGNAKSLYHRLSPYSQYDANQGLIRGFTKQPYWWVYPDENNKGLNALKRYESRVFPLGSAPIDVIRTAKFLGSGNGIIFLGKQFLLQTGNAFNETRIYNPTSPLIAAGMGLALGSIRPQRNFDTSAGLGGIARTLIGNAIPDALFGPPKVNPPSGTIASALPDTNSTTGGKGLLRAGTANRGLSHLQAAWPQNQKGAGVTSTFKSVVSGLVKSLFANFIPQNQSGFVARSDEGAYGLMIGAGATKFVYLDKDGSEIGFGQQWVAGGKNIRKNKQYPSRPYRMFLGPDGKSVQILNDNLQPRNLSGVGSVGYTVTESGKASAPGYRYGENVGVAKSEDYEASDIMLQYASYAAEKNKYPTKRSETDIVRNTNLQMTKLLNKIKATGVYDVVIPDGSRVITSNQQSDSPSGYDRLFKTAEKGKSPINYALGVLHDYRTSRVVDNTLTTNPSDKSVKLPTAGRMDALNTLTVLGKDQKVPNSLVKGWTKWQPYVDDQIAFFFYDVVNEKYIPFRCTVKGLNESLAASWEEMQFIGRGDKVYSYGGFNRNLSFGMKVVIGSISELAPTWQRINYLATLVKPANYTFSQQNQVYNRFMIPPMVMLTLGDMYKDHPILINSINIVVPDDASWETQHQVNKEQWEYLASFIKNKEAVKFGQLPREVDISIGAILLEKERAIVGGANFGHAPRQDKNEYRWNDDALLSATQRTPFDQSLVVNKDNVIIYSDSEAAALEQEFS